MNVLLMEQDCIMTNWSDHIVKMVLNFISLDSTKNKTCVGQDKNSNKCVSHSKVLKETFRGVRGALRLLTSYRLFLLQYHFLACLRVLMWLVPDGIGATICW